MIQRSDPSSHPWATSVATWSDYATQMQQSTNAYYGYAAWPVYVSTTRGYALLPVGFSN